MRKMDRMAPVAASKCLSSNPALGWLTAPCCAAEVTAQMVQTALQEGISSSPYTTMTLTFSFH
jgi:hypothetical protein